MIRIATLGTVVLALTLSIFAQSSNQGSGQITGVVTDPNQSVVAGAQVTLTDLQTKAKSTALTNSQGIYVFRSLPPGSYAIEVDAKGFKPSISPELTLSAGQTVNSDAGLAVASNAETVNVSAGSENAYRVDTVKPGGPLGTVPIVDVPYSVNVISRQLIDDTQSRNFKEAAKYLPLVEFQEMQGPEVLRPESRGMQGSNMQNDRKDGMGIAVTTPSAMEEYEQLEVITGLGSPLYGPANPSGMFNFVTKRPTDEPLRELELQYEGRSIGTFHGDFGGRVGPHKMFGYRTNLLIGDGTGYVARSQLRRQLAAMAIDMRITDNTVIEGNFSYYNLFQHGYPGWFSYTPSLTATSNVLLPVNAPDPERRGYGQSFSGVDLNNQIGEVRVQHHFGSNWHLMLGVLNQLADRSISTAVNSFLVVGQTYTINGKKVVGTPGEYATYLANSFSSLAPRFHVSSDLGYLEGKFRTGRIHNDVVIGGTGYRFASYSAVTGPAATPLCTVNTAAGVCTANISDPLIYVPPTAGLFSYAKTSLTNGVYISSIIHQQGFNIGDTITLNPHLLVRLAASQDWYWINSYSDGKTTNPLTNYVRIPAVAGNFSTQGVSPSASIMFKPKENMTVYGTFAQSLQAPDVAPASSATTKLVNANLPLPFYRAKEGEIGYKLVLRKINFSTAAFRIQRPFAETVSAPAASCGTLTAGQTCGIYAITGLQVNYGVEAMLSGRVIEPLMITGGITVLSPKLTDTGIAATNNKTFVGIPDYHSNILAEYHLPILTGAFFNFDWQHYGRRWIDDVNSTAVPQFNTFDLGLRYTAKFASKYTTWRVWANNVSNVHYWSTLGPGSITGNPGTSSYLGHLGEPRLIMASMRMDF
jgi:iron complex outermembrane receptor protein